MLDVNETAILTFLNDGVCKTSDLIWSLKSIRKNLGVDN